MTDRKRAGTIAAVIMAASVLMTACGSNTSAASGTGVAGSSVVSEEVSSDASVPQDTGSSESGTVSSETGTESSENEADEKSDGIIGQITKVSGNDITITVADSAGGPGNGEAPSKPDGDKPADGADKPTDDGNKPADGADKPTDDGSKPADGADKPADDGNKPADGADKPADDGNKPADGSQPGIKLSDETKTVTVSASTTYKLSDDSDGALSDLKADDYVKIVMDGDNVVSVTVMDMSSK